MERSALGVMFNYKMMGNKSIGILETATIGLLLVFPFIVLEWINRRGMPEAFPVFLFATLWLLASLFIFLAEPVVRSLKAGKKFNAPILLRVILLLLVACFWAGLVIDQMPCFLGQYNCD